MDVGDGTSSRAGDLVSTAGLELIAAAREYFSHQSMGANILKSLENLQDTPTAPVIRVVEPGGPDVVTGPGGASSAYSNGSVGSWTSRR